MVGKGSHEQAGDERGQALTLEAITAALLLLSAVGFALQMTAVTPLSASTSSQHLENQLEAEAEGVLASSAETGALQEAVLYWNSSEGAFHNTPGDLPYYTSGPPDNSFGDELRRTFSDRNIAVNINVRYQDTDGEILFGQSQRMIRQGQPSDNAVSATRSVLLVDSDRLVKEDGSFGEQIINLETEQDEFYAPDTGDQQVYNVVRVEVVVWRI